VKFKQPLFLAIAIVCPLFIGAAAPGFVQDVRTTALNIVQPFVSAQAKTAFFVRSQICFLLKWPTLQKKMETLEQELKRAKGELASVSELKREHSRLAALLKLKGEFARNSIAARVIWRDPSHWSQFIVISKGTKGGIGVDTVLISPEGLVGKVVAVGVRSSRAILLADLQSRVSALNERTRDVGLIEGMNGPLLKMTYLDRNSKIQVGDVIISSGLGGIYPKGIPIGRVKSIAEEDSRLNLYALVEPFVSFSKLEEVLCILS